MATRRDEDGAAPELSSLFRAYLNQDWSAEYDTVWDAVRDYCSGYPTAKVNRAAEQVHQILEGNTDEARLESVVGKLGLEYYPPGDGSTYRAWLTELANVLSSQ